MAGDQVDAIVAAAHDIARNVIRNNPVGLLGAKLGFGIGDDFMRLGRKADQQPGPVGMLS